MDNSGIFGRTLHCPCGKTHRIEPREVVYQDDAVSLLPLVCRRAAETWQVAVLMDQRTRAAAGRRVAEGLAQAGWRVTELLVPDLPGGRTPICDDRTRDALAGRVRQIALIVTVGSGVVTDLGKWLAADACVPFVSFATAASMNGYASANVAPTVAGVKTLVQARPPVAVLSEPAVLAAAPYELTTAGLGDVLAKSVSSADWRMNHLLFGHYYCPRSVALTDELEDQYAANPRLLREKDPAALEALFRALLLTGAAMTMADSSAPASGGEHMISHCLDMMSSLDGAEHDLHGRQVGVGTVLATALYRRVLATESPAFVDPPTGVDRPFWGPLADVVAHQFAQKVPRLAEAGEKLCRGQAWDDLRRELAPMIRRPEQIRTCLREADAATTADHIRCDRDRLLRAFLHAHEIRSRFTILELAWLTGVLPKAAGELIEQWA